MSTITNDPILLNETGLQMVAAIKEQNSLLAMIAEGNRSDIYADVGAIANIVRNGLGEKVFPIGDQIIIPWKDMDDSAHNTDETAYQVPWNVVAHGEVELQTGEIVPGMFIQWHYCSPYGVQFSHQQAFLNCPDGLTAGTYYITLASNWGSNAVANTAWHFTLTQAVPAGGRLSGFEGMPDQATSNWKVKSWATPTDAEPIETVAVASGTSGTNLGIMPYSNPDEESGLNCMQSVAYGHNRWSTSALRQYLNSSGENWWASKEDYDIRPDQYAKKGFLSGFSNDFLLAIKPIKVVTALNTVEDFTEASEATFDKVFLPSLEQMNANPQLAGVEGFYFPYWRRRLGLNGFNGWNDTNKNPNYITTAINAQTSAQNVRLRSAIRGYANVTWDVNSTGGVSDGHASYADRFAPVCVIC